MNFMFKGGTSGRRSRCGWDPSGFGNDCVGHWGLTSVFPIIFVLYLNDLTIIITNFVSIIIPQTLWNHRIIATIL